MRTLRGEAPALGYAPLPNEMGQRVGAEICQVCWRDWLQKQTQIINHYGLDLMNPDAQEFLFANMKGYLFGEAPPKPPRSTPRKKGRSSGSC